MGVTPRTHVAHHIDRVARRPWLRVQVRDLFAGSGSMDLPALTQERNPIDFCKSGFEFRATREEVPRW